MTDPATRQPATCHNEAHAAIVLILSDMPRDYRFTDAADDILDAIWPEPATTQPATCHDDPKPAHHPKQPP